MRIPLAVDLHINAFSGATISELGSGITNGLIEKDEEGLYVTQRPPIDVTEDASNNTAKTKGRGIFYWEAQGAKYIVNDDTLYKNSQASVVGTITSGVDKVKFLLLDETLIILDKQGNQGWTVDTGDNLTEITDTDFPPKKGTPDTLCYGGAILDGYVFVGTEEGRLYNSDNGSATAYSALSFLTAERDPDKGVYVGKQNDHIIFYGTRTTEAFYNNANPTGSPLNRRQDIAHTIGCADGRSVWEAGDIHFLVGTDSPGARRIYKFENLQYIEISTPTIASFITQALAKDSFLAMGSGVSAHGRLFYILTLYKAPDSITPYTTLVYDDRATKWYVWGTTVNGLTKFPLVDWTTRTGVLPRYGEGILSNGDIITLNDNMTGSDTLAESKIVEDGILLPGIVEESAASSAAVNLKVRTGMIDHGTNKRKFAHDLSVVGDVTPNSQTLTIKHSNEKSNAFNAGKSVDLSKYQKLSALGSYRRRNYELDTSSTDVVRLRALEGEVTLGSN